MERRIKGLLVLVMLISLTGLFANIAEFNQEMEILIHDVHELNDHLVEADSLNVVSANSILYDAEDLVDDFEELVNDFEEDLGNATNNEAGDVIDLRDRLDDVFFDFTDDFLEICDDYNIDLDDQIEYLEDDFDDIVDDLNNVLPPYVYHIEDFVDDLEDYEDEIEDLEDEVYNVPITTNSQLMGIINCIRWYIREIRQDFPYSISDLLVAPNDDLYDLKDALGDFEESIESILDRIENNISLNSPDLENRFDDIRDDLEDDLEELLDDIREYLPYDLEDVEILCHEAISYVGFNSYLPLTIDHLTEDTGIISFQFKLTVMSNEAGDFLDISTDETLSSDWTVVHNQLSENCYMIAGSGINSLTGPGSLLDLVFSSENVGEITLHIWDFRLNTSWHGDVYSGISVNPFIYGDVNTDSEILAYDASLALQFSAGLDPLPGIDILPWEDWRFAAADVSGDGLITAMDASYILQYVVGIIDEFPIESVTRDLPVADISISVENNELVVSADGELFGLNLELPEVPGVTWGEPEMIAEVMLVSNDEVGLKVASCSAYARDGEILRIPFTATSDVEEVSISMISNVEEHTETVSLLTTAVEPGFDVVPAFELKGNYPNPFNPETTISFSVAESGSVELSVYNVKGQKVKTLVSSNVEAGSHQITWKGNDDRGNLVASGIYFYKLRTGRYTSTKKMILMK
jgi:hypothetical protein